MLSFTNFVLAASVLAVAAGQASAASIQPRSSISATTFQYGGTYLGCYTDSSSRVLNGQSFTSSTQMTIEACANACGLYNYRYAGVEYGSECYCGNTAPKSSLALSDSKCSTYTCPGNSTETCGGYYALQAYDNTYLAPGYSSTTSSSSTSTASSTSTTSTSKSTSTSSTSTSSTSTSTSSTSTSSSSTSTSTAKTSTTSTASSTSTASTSTVTSTAKTSTSTTSTATSSTAAAKATYSYSGAALGCFQDNAGFGGSRTLNAYTFSATNMTLESCANTCGSQNYKYAGTEYANQCWCDNVLPTNSSTSCNMACAGDATETCGGSWALSVVDNKAITAPVVAATTQIVVASTYGASNLGCFVDNLGTGGARTLGAYSVSASNMTNEICANTCGAQGWKYSGVEYGQECYCGATLPTNPSTACTMPCAGNSGETCGGSWALSVFDNTAISSTGNLASNYNSLGCYLDSTSARTLASYSYTSSSMTISTCAAKCSSLNYAFSGVEYGQECYCGNVAPAVTSTACTMSCAGSNSQICGGSNALSIVRDTSISATSATCSGLPSGYVACMEGQKVSGGVCVAA